MDQTKLARKTVKLTLRGSLQRTDNGKYKRGRIYHKLLFEGNKVSYSSWQKPDKKSLTHEYNIEYGHHIRQEFGNIWPTFKDFMKSINKAKTKVLSSTSGISGMTQHRDMAGIIDLISNYASYPEFRNEKTVKKLYTRFETNKPMDMPLVLKTNRGLQIMAGNTRSDIAFQLGIKPKVLVIDITELI